MIPVSMIKRVIRICVGNSKGTAFTMTRGGTRFLVTAKHLFKDENYPNSTVIGLLIDKQYKSFHVDVRYPIEIDADVAVILLDSGHSTAPNDVVDFSVDGVLFGQDVYFMGFPFEYEYILKDIPDEKIPVPFVKKACLSALLNDNAISIILDGNNNPGFSGGPAFFENKSTGKISICGVISGYRYNKLSVCDELEEEQNLFVKENTGLILVTDIKYAVNIADQWAQESQRS